MATKSSSNSITDAKIKEIYNRSSQRIKRKPPHVFKIPSNQETFFQNLKNTLAKNENRHGINPTKLNLVFSKYLKKDLIFSKLKEMEEKLNKIFKRIGSDSEELVAVRNSGSIDNAAQINKELNLKVTKIVSPLYRLLTNMILKTNYVNDIVKFNIIAICVCHLNLYTQNEECRNVLSKTFKKLIDQTKRNLLT